MEQRENRKFGSPVYKVFPSLYMKVDEMAAPQKWSQSISNATCWLAAVQVIHQASSKAVGGSGNMSSIFIYSLRFSWINLINKGSLSKGQWHQEQNNFKCLSKLMFLIRFSTCNRLSQRSAEFKAAAWNSASQFTKREWDSFNSSDHKHHSRC